MFSLDAARAAWVQRGLSQGCLPADLSCFPGRRDEWSDAAQQTL